MKMVLAGCITLVGAVLFFSQWLTPERKAMPAIEIDVLREYNQRAAIPVRDIREIPEPVFNELMGRRVRQINDELVESRDSANKEGLLGICGALIGGAGVGWLARQVRRRGEARVSKGALPGVA